MTQLHENVSQQLIESATVKRDLAERDAGQIVEFFQRVIGCLRQGGKILFWFQPCIWWWQRLRQAVLRCHKIMGMTDCCS